MSNFKLLLGIILSLILLYIASFAVGTISCLMMIDFDILSTIPSLCSYSQYIGPPLIGLTTLISFLILILILISSSICLLKLYQYRSPEYDHIDGYLLRKFPPHQFDQNINNNNLL